MADRIKNKTASAEKALQRFENEGGSCSCNNRRGVKDTKDIKVLLIDGAEPDHASMRDFLQQHVAPSFEVYCYDYPEAAIRFLQKNSVDIILLDFGAIEKGKAEDVFQSIQKASMDTPIVIFTGQSEHDLALLIMYDGAEDRITREQFKMTPESLRDVIEFSLARRKALMSHARAILQDAKKTGALKLREFEKRGAAELKTARAEAAEELNAAQEKGAAELETTHEEAAAELKAVHKESEAVFKKINQERQKDIRSHKETLSWMSGGYSIDPLREKNEDDENAWRFIASELKLAQEQRAAQLKETHEKDAAVKKAEERKGAMELRRRQQDENEKLG